MLKNNACPFQPQENNRLRIKPFYANIKFTIYSISLFLILMLFLLPISGVFRFFLAISLTGLMLFVYPLCLRFKFPSNTNKKLPICSIFTNFYDIIFRQELLLRDFDLERKAKLGNIYLTFFGLRPAIIVTNAALAELISKDYLRFVKSDPRDLSMPYFYKWVGNNNIVLANGKRWQEIRAIIHPQLNEVQIFAPLMINKINLFMDKIDQELQVNKSPEVKLTRWLKALSLDIAGEALFGYNFNHLHEETNPGIAATDYVLNEIFNPVRIALPIINKLPIKSNKKLKTSIHLLDALVDQMINYYETSHEEHEQKNVLSLLLKAKTNNALNALELRNNILTLVLASHETTQVALSAVLYFLAKYPNLQAELRAESIALLPDLAKLQNFEQSKDKKNTLYWKLKTFENLENFILESLRLYSPLANQNPRTTIEDVNLNGFKIPRGTLVIMNLHAIHLDSREWHDADKFDMHRFKKGSQVNKFAYLPFGNGPRICSGREFSLIEQKLAVCHILRKFEISLPNNNYIVPILRYSFTGLPDDTFKLCFKKLDY